MMETTVLVDEGAALPVAWGLPLQAAGCPVCRQAHLVESALLGKVCPNCGRGRLEVQPARLRPEPPELLIPFRLPAAQLRGVFARFVRPVRLRPDDFNAESLARRAVPVFWPMWLVDGDLEGDWVGEVGYDYQVKSSQESYAAEGWRTRDVVESRIRWEPRAGGLRRHYDNAAAPAVSDHARIHTLVGNYPQKEAVAYDPALVGQASVRIPDQPPESAWPLAQSALHQAAAAECARATAAQHTRSFNIHAEYQNLHWTQLLQPMYVSFYTADDGTPQLVFVNGQSGQVGGLRLASQRKGWIWAGGCVALALLLFLLGVGAAALAPVIPFASLLSCPLFMAGLAALVAAVVPAAWPWQWNRGQLDVKVTHA